MKKIKKTGSKVSKGRVVDFWVHMVAPVTAEANEKKKEKKKMKMGAYGCWSRRREMSEGGSF